MKLKPPLMHASVLRASATLKCDYVVSLHAYWKHLGTVSEVVYSDYFQNVSLIEWISPGVTMGRNGVPPPSTQKTNMIGSLFVNPFHPSSPVFVCSSTHIPSLKKKKLWIVL